MQPTPRTNLIFEVTRSETGTFRARCPNASIFTGGIDLEELYGNITAALEDRYLDDERPAESDVHLVMIAD